MNGNSEIEIVLYTKIGDVNGLEKADRVEKHEQMEARLMDGSKIRVRKTTSSTRLGTGENAEGPVLGESVRYEFTAKRKPPQTPENAEKVSVSTEYTCECTEEFFNTFGEIMEQKLIKTRYYFKNKSIKLKLGETEEPILLDNVGFEVDVFSTRGSICEWAKIDVEIDPILGYLKDKQPDLKQIGLRIKASSLPFKPTELIYKPTASPEQLAIIDNLWKNEYTIGRDPAL